MKILRAGIKNLNEVTRMFNGYRMFYKQPSDMERCKKFIEQRLQGQDSVIFIAVDSDDANVPAKGFVQLYPSFTSVGTNKIYVVNDMYVEPEQRSKGIGKSLLRQAKQFALENGASKLSLMTAKDNPAQKLYEAQGYKRDVDFVHYNLSLAENSTTSDFLRKSDQSARIKTKKADQSSLEAVSKLFNDYRMFYKQGSDLIRAKTFIEERLRKQDSAIFIAVDPEKSLEIGFGQLYPSFTSVGTERIYILNDLYILPEYRGIGVGGLLMKKAKEFALENNAVKLTLMTAKDNFAGQKLYEREGYKVDDKFLHYNLALSKKENVIEGEKQNGTCYEHSKI